MTAQKMFEDLGRTITESERSIIYEKGFRTISFLRNSNDLNIVDSSGHIDMECLNNVKS